MQTKPKRPGVAKRAKKQKGKPGRNFKFEMNAEGLQRVEDLAAQQLHEKEIAYCLGLNPNYFSGLKAERPELAEAVKRGTARGLELATATIVNAMKKKNISAAMFFLKCKGGWRENGPADNKGNDQESTQSAIQTALQRITG